MEYPFYNDEYDIKDIFDEDLSATLGDDFQCPQSIERDSTYPTIIPKNTNSPTTLQHASSAIQPLPSVANAISSSSVTEAPPVAVESPAKRQLKRSHSPIVLTFGNPQQVNLGTLNHEDDGGSSEVLTSHGSLASKDEATISVATKTKRTDGRVRPASQTYDHLIAERKRREQLNQRFMTLSAIVPGLKKLDKTSVLGDAITYLKHLKERVRMLEEQDTKQTMESVVRVKKSQILAGEDEGSSDELSVGIMEEQPLPEIEAKLCDKKVLLRVHCENQKGVLVKILSEVQKFNLAVTNTSVAPFGNLAVDITIIAEVRV